MWSDPLRHLLQKVRGNNHLPSWRFSELNDRLVDVASLDRALVDVGHHPALVNLQSFRDLVTDARQRFPREDLKQAVFLYTGETPLFCELNTVLRIAPTQWGTHAFEVAFRHFASYIPFLLKGLQDECP